MGQYSTETQNCELHGIVLDYNSARGFWLLVTPHAGIITLYPSRFAQASAWGRGNLVAYRLKDSGRTPRLDSIELMRLPACWAHADISFLHHALELIIFFVPAHHEARDLFAWCLQLYSNDQITAHDTSRARILFLIHLMYSIGMYPDTADSALMNSWCMVRRGDFIQNDALDALIKQANPLEYQQMIRWLWSCINEHPRVHTLKTISYLKVLDHENYWCSSDSCW